ncbi:hypothetical protein [Actinomadura rifamycini]|uniref:hypothetical protein n=1 Tax=Actinomadura rifamycini TaxID=31962 RepID=UPI000408306A|nr:hypothetical protein [Actinomadura rifamycini]
MTRPPHDPHPHARAPEPAGPLRAADRRKPGRFDLRRPVPRLLALGAGTLLAATAIIVTTSAAAAAAPADGPPVPTDAAPLPMGRPAAPVFPNTGPGTEPDAGATSSMVEILQAPAQDAPPARNGRPAEAAEASRRAPAARKPAARPGKPGGLAPPSKTMHLDHAFVTDVLRSRDIEWRSTGNCSDREKPTCTSFDGLRWTTLDGLLRFADKSGCRIVVTGGTERGHAPGRHSHYNGYKIDIAPTPCVDREIEGYDREGVRGDGSKLYRSPEGGLYARESDHWDITYT